MKKCSRCQADNFEDQKFCNLCGKELKPRLNLDTAAVALPNSPSRPSQQGQPQQRAYQHFLKAKDAIKIRNLPVAVGHFQAALALCPSDPMIRRLLQKTIDAHEKAKQMARATGLGPRSAPTGSPPLPPRAEKPARVGSGSGIREMPSPRTALTSGRTAVTNPWDEPSSEPMQTRPVPAVAPSIPGLDPSPGKTTRSSPPLPRMTGATEPKRPASEPVHSPGPRPAERTGDSLRSKGRSTPVPGAAAAEPKPRSASQTGRFLESYGKAPGLSPALLLDARDEGMKEILVSFLILGSFVAFGFLLLL